MASKLGGSGAGPGGLDRNRKSSREDFNVSTAAAGRSSSVTLGSGAATSSLLRAAGAYCAGPLGESGVSSPCGADILESGPGASVRGMAERSRSIAAAETSTDEGEGCWVGSARASRSPASGRLRGAAGIFGAAGRGLDTAIGGGSGVAGTLGGAGANIWSCSGTRAGAPPLRASAKRESSVTTAESPIRMKPPISAVAPPSISVVPSVNSLSGIPNPIAATPQAATTIPRINNNTAIGLRPARYATLRDSPTARGSKPTVHDLRKAATMVTK